jgi:hypothetical protein
MRYGIAILICLATTFLCTVAQKPHVSGTPQELPAAIRDLLNAARMAEPEAKTDALLRLAKDKRLSKTSWPRKLVEEAFHTIRQVKNPARLKLVPVKGVPVDTHAGYLSYAHDQKLDSYSLLSRVIRQMLALDKERARQIVFEMNGRLSLKKIDCNATLVYDVSDLYAAVGEVAMFGFRKKEIDEGVRALFLAPWFENIESPSQIAPALDLLLNLQSSHVDRQILSTAMAKALASNFGDDRSFTFAIERDQIPSKVFRLTTGIDDPSKAELRAAYREFLIRNLTGARCSENKLSGEELPAFVLVSNQTLLDKPIQFKDIADGSFEGRARIAHYWRSGEAKKRLDQIRQLRANKQAIGESDADRLAEWESKVGAFIEDLGQWDPSLEESESEIFNQKCVLFLSVADMVPAGKMRRFVVLAYMRFLNSSGLQKEKFIEWNYYAVMLSTSHADLFRELAADVPNTHFQLIRDLKVAKL